MAGRRSVCQLSAREICKNELSVWSTRYNSITNDSLGPIFSSSPKVMALPLRISFPACCFSDFVEFQRNGGLCICTVQHHEYRLAFVLACVGINTILYHELHHAAFGNHIVSFAPVQDGLVEVVALVLYFGTSGWGQCVCCVTGPSTGKSLRT